MPWFTSTPAAPPPPPSLSLYEDIARRIEFELVNAPSYLPEGLHDWFLSVWPHPFIELWICFVTCALTFLWLSNAHKPVIRHCNWLVDTLWAAPCIVLPEFMDKLYTPKFLKEFEDLGYIKTKERKQRKTIGIVLCMGAQNAGCHLVYWKLMSTLRSILESEHNVNVVFEVNRWCRDGPMSHADDNLSEKRFPKSRLRHLAIRRLVGDYIGVPILFLQSKLATKSLNASVERLEKRLGDAGLYTNSELCIFCHSLGGPVAYRYLQQYKHSNISKIFSVGSMNHYTNALSGLGNSSVPGTSRDEPFFPVRVPHLDILDGADFLSFPFYASGEEDTDLPQGDDDHSTKWIKESWLPFVFAHTGYAHCESFYRAVVKFLMTETVIVRESQSERR
ncbi:hypothetical protein TrST_g5491 [Triparma strigata]|uniref:Uncharacterized protein n=1 Tax=Triparma strigata TaxID=1606541 RepID=A0A9W7E0V7_9STRA|nr:hypothetical protein TrST_g5491 [Triparma strigata]